MYSFLYPGEKQKAVTFSYDDGEVFDRRLVNLFNQYKVKGTFHLNSGKLGMEGFISEGEVAKLYQGHEVAAHGKQHLYLTHLPKEAILQEVYEDRKSLETLLQNPVWGYSYAFGEYNSNIVEMLDKMGILYARTVNSTGQFSVPASFTQWHPTCHHNENLITVIQEFQYSPSYIKLPLLYVWGHSFEFERDNNWDMLEQCLERVSAIDDVWFATNFEYYEYVTALRSLRTNIEGNIVMNPAGIPIYLKINGQNQKLDAGETLHLK